MVLMVAVALSPFITPFLTNMFLWQAVWYLAISLTGTPASAQTTLRHLDEHSCTLPSKLNCTSNLCCALAFNTVPTALALTLPFLLVPGLVQEDHKDPQLVIQHWYDLTSLFHNSKAALFCPVKKWEKQDEWCSKLSRLIHTYQVQSSVKLWLGVL